MDFRISRKLLSKLRRNPKIKKHFEIMENVLLFLSEKKVNLLFKGGSALMFFYEGDRFSEDLDFDAYVNPEKFSARDLAYQLSKYLKLEVNVVKDTKTTKRLKIKVPDLPKDIKIEISFRKFRELKERKTEKGFEVYSVDEIAKMKLEALEHRVTARDLHDIAFILDTWLEDLKRDTLKKTAEFFGAKDLESWIEGFEKDFARDARLGEFDFYKTYGRLIEGLAEVKFSLEQAERKKNSLKNKM